MSRSASQPLFEPDPRRLTLGQNPDGFGIYVACPITEHIDPDTDRLVPDYERFVRSLHAVVLTCASEAFLAVEREAWGAAWMPGEVCAPLDMAEMRRCDAVVAYPGRSCGVGIELGWATAWGKPIILLLEHSRSYSPVLCGLSALPGQRIEIVELGEGFLGWHDGPPKQALRAHLTRLRSERSAVRKTRETT